jgi:hypothetical protein
MMLTRSASNTMCLTFIWLRVCLYVARQNRHEDAAGNQCSRGSAHHTVLLAHLIPAAHCTVITEADHQMRWPRKAIPGDSLKKAVAGRLCASWQGRDRAARCTAATPRVMRKE